MKIMSCVNFPSSTITDRRLASIVSLNGDVGDLVFQLSEVDERPQNLVAPVFASLKIKSNLDFDFPLLPFYYL